MGTYIFYRLVRLPGSSYAIAAGFACGAAASFTPFVGFHFLLAFMLAWIIGGKMIAAGLGTLVGNPWTFPFIWTFLFRFGRWMGAGEGGPDNPAFVELFAGLFKATFTMDMVYMQTKAWPVLLPMLVASIPASIVVWLLIFFGVKRVVSNYKKAQTARLLKKTIELPHLRKQIPHSVDDDSPDNKLEGAA